jgi:hypothetical protein
MENMNLCDELRKFVLLLFCVGLVGGCASAPKNVATTKNVEITFNAQGCPTAVTPNTAIEISKSAGDKVKWQAVDSSGDDLGTDFDIYFDPFKGRPLNSNRKGRVQSPPIDSDTPVGVEFKYTIVGSECLASPLDPRIIIL